ncbi:hypothetical protein [Teredinibacter franksiae]|uniref:hypothetical protein n=1 Tax=Teredinibacter franksiae TaxID=2761453 RepID=UPI0016290A11|nr:hypothetical protein [Teredinibacter franksiae]
MISSYMGVVKQAAIRLALITAVVGLAACGGGDKKNKPTPTLVPTQAPDTTPADFSFTLPQATFGVGEEATSDSITITGLDTLTDISISAGGEYAIDGGSFTSAAGQIANNQTLVVRAMAGANFDDAVAVTVNIGTESQTFTVVTEPADTTPTDFSFTLPQLNYERGELATTTSITITGLNTLADISVSAGGEYSVDGGSFTSAAGQIANDQTLAVRVTAGANFDETLNVTVNIGTASQTFSVVTEAQDTTPEVFSFTDAVDAVFASTVESNSISITAINDAAPISITGGEYSIAGGAFVSVAGTVSSEQEVIVRGIAPTLASATQNVVLTVGGVSDTFSIASPVDNTPPVAEIYFPTQVGLTDQAELQVRGVATDDMSSITAITVNGIDAASSDDFANWQVTVPLALGDTEIAVIATDAVGNSSEVEVLATITRRDDLTGAFPLNDYDVVNLYALKFIDNYQTLVAAERYRKIYKMNPQTGELSVFSNGEDPLNDNDTLNNRVFRLAYFDNLPEPRLFCLGKDIHEIDLETGERTLFAETAFNDPEESIDSIRRSDEYKGIASDSSYMLAHNGGGILFKVNLASAQRNVVSDPANVDQGHTFGSGYSSISIAPAGGVVYATTGGISDSTLSVDLETGFRTFISGEDVPEGNSVISTPYDTEISGDETRMYITGAIDHSTLKEIRVMNLQAGEDYGRTTAIRSELPPGQIPHYDMELWEARGLVYVNDFKSVAVVDLVTGDAVILFKYAF